MYCHPSYFITSCLLGVAISASLLPPAVNSGMLILIMAVGDDPDWGFDDYSTTSRLFKGGMVGGVYHPRLSMAITSLFLTISNVVLVALGAIVMFRIKEVMEVEKTVFWTDLKMARTMKYHGIGTDDDNVGGGARAQTVEGAGADESHFQNEQQQQQQPPYPEVEL